jgi:hypothetical protein
LGVKAALDVLGGLDSGLLRLERQLQGGFHPLRSAISATKGGSAVPNCHRVSADRTDFDEHSACVRHYRLDPFGILSG